jgi:hypothetical protein
MIRYGELAMPQAFPRERLADWLIDPREDLNFEIKNWLDLRGDNDAKATFAKAALALANHGGGFIALGLEEADTGVIEAQGRPAAFDAYGQDLINGIIQNYADPAFHCAVHIVPNPDGALFPIVVVPGGHRVPIRARRAGPHGNTVESNAIYIRKPGPRSETPQSAQEWDGLLARCLANRRDEMFDQIRDLISGVVPQVATPPEAARFQQWIEGSVARWNTLIAPLPQGVGPRCPHGYHWFAYEIEGAPRAVEPARLPELLRASVVRHTGWPPFWYPTRAGIAPYPFDGLVECWLGGDEEGGENRDAAHSDFCRIAPNGSAFLLRGYQEDGIEAQRPGHPPPVPGTLFDITLPIWRVAEVLLHAASLADSLIEGPATINFVVHYSGLAGRRLTSISGRRHVWDNRVAHQGEISLQTRVDAESITPNLPEIIRPLLAPLYALFDFTDLPMALVTEELAQMRGGQF